MNRWIKGRKEEKIKVGQKEEKGEEKMERGWKEGREQGGNAYLYDPIVI